MSPADRPPPAGAPRGWWRRLADRWYLLLSWGFALMAAATAYEVVARYFLRQPTIWAAELTTLLCGTVFLCSGMYAMRSDSHLSITILSDIAPRPVKIVLATIKLIVIVAFCFGLSVVSFNSGWEPLITWERAGTQWNSPTPAILKPLIVVVAVVMALQAAVNYARSLRRLTRP